MPYLSSKPNFVYQPSTEIGKNIDRNRYSTLSCKKIVKDIVIRRFFRGHPDLTDSRDGTMDKKQSEHVHFRFLSQFNNENIYIASNVVAELILNL